MCVRSGKIANRYRVAVVSSEYPPNIAGGVGIHVGQILRALARRVRHDLFVPALADYSPISGGSRLHQVNVPRSQTDTEFWLGFCHNIVKSIETFYQPPQVVHCHDWMTVLAGVRLRATLGIPLVFNVHLPTKIGDRACLENLGLVSADVVIVNSRQVQEELMGRSLPIRRIEIVPNGVDGSEFCPGSDWPRDDGYVLFVGRLVMQKGIDLLLQAFAIVLRRCPQSHLVIVGDGDLELYLRRVTSSLGILHRVRFVEWQTGPALLKYYQNAQVVVVPSYYEPFGLVALEAMACGRPVIASRTGGLSEIIANDVQGRLVSVGDYLQLATELTRLILDSKLRRKMGKAARARALLFGWDRAARRILQLYDTLVGTVVPPNAQNPIRDIAQELLANAVGGQKHLYEELLGLDSVLTASSP